MKQSPPVFLSSVFADPADTRLHLRDRVIEMTGGHDVDPGTRTVWVAEDYDELKPSSDLDSMVKTELCLDGVRDASCFVAVITSRHGSEIDVPGIGQVASSFFEAELFEAALLGRPAHVFLLEGYDPEPRLANLLKLLGPAFPNFDLRPMSEEAIAEKIARLVDKHRQPFPIRSWFKQPRLRLLIGTLFGLRHTPYDTHRSPPPIRFLDGLGDSELPPPDPDKIVALLELANSLTSHQRRLTLLWFAIRSLMGAPYHVSRFHSYLPLWERAFEDWKSNGAWFGLHGHASLGCLASLGSLSEIRVTNDRTRADRKGVPHGAIASEYYSIAKLAGKSRKIFQLALEHSEASIVASLSEGSGALAIRGSIYLQLGRMEEALADYARVVELREGRMDSSYGDALSELGHAVVLNGNVKQGIGLIEQGRDILVKEGPSGFLIRSTRKLALAYARRWHFVEALDLAVEAHDLAMQLGAHDQIRRAERLAKSIDRMRRR